MIKILTCVVTEHDIWTVLVAAVVCLGGSFTSLRLFSRLNAQNRPIVQGAWMLLIGMVAGASVWATHFIAMLAYSPGVKSGFLPSGTLLSLVIAVLFMATAFGVASRRDGIHRVAGGALAGLGVAAMHYTGMAAYVVQGYLVWDLPTVAASVLLGVGGAVATMLFVDRSVTLGRQAIGAGLMTLAICVLHFTSMGAITVVPDPAVAAPVQALSSGVMLAGVTAMAGLIVMIGLGVVMIEGGVVQSALERSRRLADAAYEGIVVVQGNRITDANAAFCGFAGASVEVLAGHQLDGALLTFDADDPAPFHERREGLLRPLGGGAAIPVEVFGRLLDVRPDGEVGDHIVLAVRDLRERRQAEEKIRHLAEHDGLTGLANRVSLQGKLADAVTRVRVTGESLAVICIDLDHFKEANDSHGHLAGDAILGEVAQRLRAAVTGASFAARLGGDEFAVVQMGGEQPAAAVELAQQLMEALSRPAMFEGQELAVGASLGISLHSEDGDTPEALLAAADMALYRAKEAGRGGFRFFKREMDDNVRERRTLARELRTAIAAEELVVHYQPLARAQDAEICGFEALVRWRHPTRGMIPPLDFIPIAEESGLIAPLGEWVLRRACADAAAWEKPLRIAVNLSPLQLHQGDLPKMVHEILIETGLKPQRLELEITESALFKDFQRALDTLRRLKALGVRIAMDDFGTGFSSLSTLQSFPFDKIKIDKSFVEKIHQEERAKVIVRAVLGLGRSLQIPVVAEGVETDEQLAFLRGEECAEVQGYAIGRPTASADLSDWTAERVAPPPRRKPRAA